MQKCSWATEILIQLPEPTDLVLGALEDLEVDAAHLGAGLHGVEDQRARPPPIPREERVQVVARQRGEHEARLKVRRHVVRERRELLSSDGQRRLHRREEEQRQLCT